MKQSPWNAQLVIGLIIIAVGVLFIMDNLDMMYAWDILKYWPAILIIVGVVKLTESHASRFWAGAFIVVGSLLLMDRMDFIDFRLHDWWPLILIAVGGSILWGSITRRNLSTAVLAGDTSDTNESILNLTAFMGGFEKKVLSDDFRGGSVTTIMGGAELDLRQAVIKGQEAVIDVVVIMGGIELTVPDTWRVILKGVPIMGGFSDETRTPSSANAPTLLLKGNVVMGGVEIKN